MANAQNETLTYKILMVILGSLLLTLATYGSRSLLLYNLLLVICFFTILWHGWWLVMDIIKSLVAVLAVQIDKRSARGVTHLLVWLVQKDGPIRTSKNYRELIITLVVVGTFWGFHQIVFFIWNH